jgi:hypothetical protein
MGLTSCRNGYFLINPTSTPCLKNNDDDFFQERYSTGNKIQNAFPDSYAFLRNSALKVNGGLVIRTLYSGATEVR